MAGMVKTQCPKYQEVSNMTNHTQKSESAIRRALRKAGYSLHKSHKGFSADNLGGFMVVDLYNNACVSGPRYELSLDDVSEWLEWVNS
jgi:hypothetical protein